MRSNVDSAVMNRNMSDLEVSFHILWIISRHLPLLTQIPKGTTLSFFSDFDLIPETPLLVLSGSAGRVETVTFPAPIIVMYEAKRHNEVDAWTGRFRCMVCACDESYYHWSSLILFLLFHLASQSTGTFTQIWFRGAKSTQYRHHANQLSVPLSLVCNTATALNIRPTICKSISLVESNSICWINDGLPK